MRPAGATLRLFAQWLRPTTKPLKANPNRLAFFAYFRVFARVLVGSEERHFCSECGLQGRIEAAHHNYDESLKICWLCRSCHAKWDWAQPKGGTLEGLYRKNLAGQTAVARDHAENVNR